MTPSSGRNLVLPAPMSGGLFLVLTAIGYAAASQSNNAAYLLGSALGAVAAVGAAHTWANLRRLRIAAESVPSVFAGDQAKLSFEVTNASRRPTFDVRIRARGGDFTAEVKEIHAESAWRGSVSFAAERRGDHPAPDLLIQSSYPIRFFFARRRVHVSQRMLVYPAPAGDPTLPASSGSARPVSNEGRWREGDDFSGVREYRLGESQRHVDWKAVARGAPLLIKQFAGTSEGRLVLDWSLTSAPGTEAKLSQLTLWVLKAESARIEYAMVLPGTDIPMGQGEAHFHRCPRALALFKEGDA